MIRVALCAVVVLGCSAGASTEPRVTGQRSADPLSSLSWLTGTWVRHKGPMTSEEMWSAPRGGTMMGINRTYRGAELVAFEFLMIRRTPQGIVYRAWPAGRGPTTFPLARRGDRTVTFENRAHDFPQRIIYRRRNDTLSARIEGDRGGAPRFSEWSWRRSPR